MSRVSDESGGSIRTATRTQRNRRVVAAIVGLAVIAGVATGAYVVLRGHPTSPSHSSQTPAPLTARRSLWPAPLGRVVLGLSRAACCATPRGTAESFARIVLAWQIPIGRETSAGVVSVSGDCAGCGPLEVHVQQYPGGGLWWVTEVVGEHFRLPLAAGESISGGQVLTVSTDLPDGTDVLVGYWYRPACGELGLPPKHRTVHNGVIRFRVATAGLHADCQEVAGGTSVGSVGSGPGPLRSEVDGFVFISLLPQGSQGFGPDFFGRPVPPTSPLALDLAAIAVHFVPGT